MWSAGMIVAIVAISWWGIREIVKVGTRFNENVLRIKHGYPTLNGDTPNYLPGTAKDAGYIDMTEDGDNKAYRN